MSVALLSASIATRRLKSTKLGALGRLSSLTSAHQQQLQRVKEEVDWTKSNAQLANLSNRLGKAGFLTAKERRRAKVILAAISAATIFIGAGVGGNVGGFIGLLVGALLGSYLGGMGAAFYLRLCTIDLQRRVSFLAPLALESLILLVESGLGILPAVEHLVRTNKHSNPVIHYLGIAYGLSANGIEFGEALRLVADATELKVIRHIFLHLDISGNEGGELIPSLRSLSNHAHVEWKLSVEQRVKRLENFVVFPVFCSVIGLMLLIAAVPLIPVMDFNDALATKSPITSSTNGFNSINRE